MAAHPADVSSGNAGHQGIGLDVAIDERACCDERVLVDRDTTNDRAIRTQGGTPSNQGVAIFILSRHRRAGVVNVCENHAWPTKHVCFERYVVVHGNIVLYPTVVAHEDTITDENVLAENTILADLSAGADMDPMPDPAAISYAGALIDQGSWMYVVAHG